MTAITLPKTPLVPLFMDHDCRQQLDAMIRARDLEVARVVLAAALSAGPPFECYCGDDDWTIGSDHACKAWEDAIRALEVGHE